jgi:dihydrodipicolinate synthase/N-acetylneuraminate lyase
MATVLPPGVYVPMPTFFLEEPADEQPVDVKAVAQHVKFLCESGVQGIVCMGTTGEAAHLTEEERQVVVRTARKTIDDLGSKAKLLAGCAQESVRGTLNLIQQAKEAGAEYAMVLPPSYFVTWAVSRSDVLVSFFTKVADKSPLPIVIYNFPGVTQQMDTPLETVVQLAAHPNIVGIKCTDGNVGKAADVCSQIDSKKFTLMSGSADSFLPFLTVGGQGCVPGLGNVVPRVLVRLFELYTNSPTDQWEEIKRLQAIIAGPDHAIFRWNGVASVKSVMQAVLGYGGLPRAPLIGTPKELQEKILKAIEPALVIERELASKSSSN